MATQLLLFDAGEVRKVRRSFAIDADTRRKRRAARTKFLESSKLLPSIAAFIASGGMVGAHTPESIESDRKLDRLDRLRERKKLKANRKSQKPRARRIFALCDLLPQWIGEHDMKLMDEEIERAAAEIQRLWSDNERRKRMLGLNASEKDPNERWTPPLASLGSSDIFGDE